MNKRKIGTEYENLACEFLEKKGYKIIDKNFRNRIGEIDIIALDGEYLCFVEVKARSNRNCGFGLEAVDKNKQKKIVLVAKNYLFLKHISLDRAIRFDVVSFDNENISVVKNAFMEI